MRYAAVLNRRMFICACTGFASGLPLFLLIQLVPAWLRLEGVSLTAIGFFTAIQYPYTLKFLWSPAIERYRLPLLGRRRGWMLATQIGLIASIAALGFWRPGEALLQITAISLIVAIFSATQDIVIDAYRREVLPTEEELALGNSIHVQVYRLSGLVPGALGLILADQMDWTWVFPIMAAFMLVGVALTLSVKEAVAEPRIPPSLWAAVREPFREFFARRALLPSLAVLAFMFFYKLGDNMATALATPFYIDLGFTPTQIGLIAKNAGLWPAIAGGILGGLAIVKIGINKALWIFGGIQFATIFGFVWLSATGPLPWALALVVGAEYLGVGLGTAASVAFIARETSHLAVATQFALFTALAALPRTLASMFSGLVVDSIGWTPFFYLCAALAVPGMVLLIWVAPYRAPMRSPDQPATDSRAPPAAQRS